MKVKVFPNAESATILNDIILEKCPKIIIIIIISLEIYCIVKYSALENILLSLAILQIKQNLSRGLQQKNSNHYTKMYKSNIFIITKC